MPHPLTRTPAAPETDEHQTELFEDDPYPDWRDGEPALPPGYDEDEDPTIEADPDELEATMMSNLEAVASAFWMESGPELAPLDDGDAQSADNSVAAPPLEPDGEDWDFRESKDDSLIGPRRGALLDFRPPRARRERPASPARDRHVDREASKPRGGAFADDLAARNKEFYDLLKERAPAPRKRTAAPEAPPVRPGFRSFFAEDAGVDRAPFVPRPAVRTALGRHAVALGIVVIAIGAGAFVVATRSGGVAAPSSAIAATAPENETTSIPPAAADGTRSLGEAVPKIVKTERVSVAAPDAAPPVAPPVDPGTLATPPLYETSDTSSSAGPAAASTNPLASLDIPPAPAASTAAVDGGGETVQPKAADAAPAAASDGDLPVAEGSGPPDNAKAEPDSSAAPDTPAPRKVASVDPKPSASSGRSKAQRGATGTATVNTAVNMRSGPDNDARVVKVVPAGARVDIVSCKMWCEVIAGGDRGYIFQRFLDRAGPRAAVAAPKAEVVKTSGSADDHQPLDLLRLIRPAN